MVEADYLAALTDAVHLEDWVQIVDRAAADAKDGDNKARSWLSKYLLGIEPPDLSEIVLRKYFGITTEAETEFEAEERMKQPDERNLDAILGHTPFRRLLAVVEGEVDRPDEQDGQ